MEMEESLNLFYFLFGFFFFN
uniref:Uncharacterized protein n=1 Tax=Rhizophora mucronata TaxID=61149 RepID=A0A2P2JSB8_RHIMU